MNLLSIVWDVSPEMFSIGPITVRYYGLLFALGFVFGYIIMQKIFKHEGIPITELDRLVMYVFFGTVIGARLGHVFFYEAAYYLENPKEILMVWQGGLASHGAAIFIPIMLWFYAKRNWNKFLWILDRIAISIPLAGGLIRLGNLMNSEIYGNQTDLAWGFIFVQNGETIAKHPTQIYEALAYFLIFGVLLLAYRKFKENTPKGLLIGWFLILVWSARFFVEFVKEVQVDFEQTMSLNMGQILSIPLVIIGIVLVVLSFKNKEKQKQMTEVFKVK